MIHAFTRFIILGSLLLPLLGTMAQPAPAPATPPLPQSPVEQFRKWLEMPPAERARALAEWPSEKREVLIRKLADYEKLPADERERRLTMVELRFYLRPLMTVGGATNRNLLLVPDRLRPLVAQRLARWDSLEPAVQKEILERDEAINYFARLRVPPTPFQLKAANSAERARLEKHLDTWRNLSDNNRKRISLQLNDFFDLPKTEQSKAMENFPPGERDEIQKTLQAFASLPSEQKRICIDSFHRFTSMTAAERSQFLKNAARWQAMSPEDRELWKRLVTKLPPMPPDPKIIPPIPRKPGPAVAESNSVSARSIN